MKAAHLTLEREGGETVSTIKKTPMLKKMRTKHKTELQPCLVQEQYLWNPSIGTYYYLNVADHKDKTCAPCQIF